jgi:hypothetical protein
MIGNKAGAHLGQFLSNMAEDVDIGRQWDQMTHLLYMLVVVPGSAPGMGDMDKNNPCIYRSYVLMLRDKII